MKKQLTTLALVIAVLVTCAAAADAQGERPGMPDRPRLRLGAQPAVAPPPGMVLWPPEAQMLQVLHLQGEELRQALKSRPELGDVTSIRIVDYIIPGAPTSSAKVLAWYDQNLKEPDWRSFFRNSLPGRDVTRVAYKGTGGFIAVMARPMGATVTHVEGKIALSDMPMLERVIREGVAKHPPAPVEARDKIEAAIRLNQAGKIDESVAAIRAVVADYPEADMAHFALARMLAEQGKSPDEAAREFRKAVQLAPMNPAHRMAYAHFLMDRGDMENAEYELQQAATIDPWSPGHALTLGRVLEKRGKLKEAEGWMRKAIERSAPADAYVDLGRVLEAQGRKDEALQAYKDALRLKPDLPQARDGVRRLEKPAQ